MGLPIMCTAAVTGLRMTRDDGRENTVLTNCTQATGSVYCQPGKMLGRPEIIPQ